MMSSEASLFSGGASTAVASESLFSFSSSAPAAVWTVRALDVIGAVIYMVLFAVILFNYLWRLRSSAILCKSLATIFYLVLPVFLLLRSLWLVLGMRSDMDGSTMFINRMALIVFLFVFASVLFFWVDTVHTTVNQLFAKQAIHGDLDFSYLSTPTKVIFWVITFAMAGFTLGIAIWGQVYYNGHPPDSSAIYNANILCVSACFLLYSGGFLFYGTRLFVRLRDKSALPWAELVKVECFSVALCLCFLLRVCMFSIRIITGKLIDRTAWYILAYWIPEMVPVVLVIWAVNSTIADDDSSHSALIPKPKPSLQDPLLASEEGSTAAHPPVDGDSAADP